MTTRFALTAALFFVPLLLGSAAPMPVRAADCRDARGEPIACPGSAPPPSAESAHRDEDDGYLNVYPFLDLSDLSGVAFAPDSPSSVPEIERGSHITGIGPGFDHAIGGLAFGFGYRPVPWLRLPDVSLAFGYGDFEGLQVDITGGGQALRGTMHEMWMLRAQIGGGLDLHLDPVRLYALGHVGIGGYFAQVDVSGSSIGGLGSDTYSAASLEAGWTVGMEIAIADDLAYTVGYRHIHTGVEQNSVFFGLSVRIR